MTKQGWDDFADVLNRLRLFPRIFVLGYGYILFDLTIWFYSVPEPTTQQTTFVTIITGLLPAVFALYTNSGYRKND